MHHFQIEYFSRKIDDACGSVSLHLVNGIWGQISVGLFAEPASGLKGIFLGGGPNQLIAQLISCTSLTIFSAVMMLIVLNFVNCFVTIKLTPEEEIMGCDILEHNLGPNSIKEVVKPPTTKLEKIFEITTPITKKFADGMDLRNRRNSEGVYRPKLFYVNEAYVSGGEKH